MVEQRRIMNLTLSLEKAVQIKINYKPDRPTFPSVRFAGSDSA